jgi:hypothetical protein
MTGAYYIGAGSCVAHRNPAWSTISIEYHCLEHPKAGVDRDDDYLGLEVWLKCVPERWSSFEVFRNTLVHLAGAGRTLWALSSRRLHRDDCKARARRPRSLIVRGSQ